MRTAEDIKALIAMGEGLRIEFKRCATSVPSDAFPSVCAFLNTEGGILLFGVEDDGTVSGITGDIPALMQNLITTLNNPQMIQPPHPLHPCPLQVDGKAVICLEVPVSSGVHKCRETIYIRAGSADLAVKEPSAIAELVNRKKQHYYERTPLPWLSLADLDKGAFSILRKRLREVEDDHPWLSLSPEEILESANLYDIDPATGNKVLTLAALLLFGTRQAILRQLPAYRIDALVRRVNLDRYDDRDMIETNLLESYLRLDGFVERHLPDPFFLEGDARISLRKKIFREVIANMLAHREYSKAERSHFVVGQEAVVVTNASNPFQVGPLNPARFNAHPKNPKIATVFNELRWVDELGSGVRNIFKYSKHYSGKEPLLEEGPVFTTTVPVPADRLYADTGFNSGRLNPALEGINYRQLQLLRHLKPGQAIGIKAYKESLPGSISLAAAKRDMNKLVKDGWLHPPGRGPKAEYMRTLKAFSLPDEPDTGLSL